MIYLCYIHDVYTVHVYKYICIPTQYLGEFLCHLLLLFWSFVFLKASLSWGKKAWGLRPSFYCFRGFRGFRIERPPAVAHFLEAFFFFFFRIAPQRVTGFWFLGGKKHPIEFWICWRIKIHNTCFPPFLTAKKTEGPSKTNKLQMKSWQLYKNIQLRLFQTQKTSENSVCTTAFYPTKIDQLRGSTSYFQAMSHLFWG